MGKSFLYLTCAAALALGGVALARPASVLPNEKALYEDGSPPATAAIVEPTVTSRATLDNDSLRGPDLGTDSAIADTGPAGQTQEVKALSPSSEQVGSSHSLRAPAISMPIQPAVLEMRLRPRVDRVILTSTPRAPVDPIQAMYLRQARWASGGASNGVRWGERFVVRSC